MAKKLEDGGFGSNSNAHIEKAGVVENIPITKTLEENYMPYAMSVILSRALPQIDGFKPSHRKLLYTMYHMGLLKGRLTKSANIVGATMKLNPHGDAAIYETMVRMSRGYEALLHPYVESKGNFGKFYSRDMDCAASRYTEAKLAPICSELFDDIDKDSVDFVPNYDNSTTEPSLLPVRFPSILVNSNVGIAVSMASAICPFNLAEVCTTAIKVIDCEEFDLLATLKGPDFPGGGFLIENEEVFKEIYETGRGSFKIRSRYSFDKKNNCIDIFEIPYTTTVEAIIEKIVSLVKQNKIKEISDIRDETDLNGLKITIDLKRGTDHKKLMAKLFALSPLEDVYSCNFNILIDGTPKVLGIREILESWKVFRQNCVRRKLNFELSKKLKRLHLIEGLSKILLNIDKAIEIIKRTKREEEVVKNLMEGFGIDSIQAEYVADIRLRNLNRQHILKIINEKDDLKKQIDDLELTLKSEKKINEIICGELQKVIEKYSVPRKTEILKDVGKYSYSYNEEEAESYLVNVFLTKQWYLKKVTMQSLKLGKVQKLKEGDEIVSHLKIKNNSDLLFFTNKANVYKTSVSNFSELKLGSLGEYVAAKLSLTQDENIIGMVHTEDYCGNVLFFYRNGKVAKISLKAYQTKTNRKKLTNAFFDEEQVVGLFQEESFGDYLLTASDEKILIFNSKLLEPKKTKGSKGVLVFKLNRNCVLKNVEIFDQANFEDDFKQFKTSKIPSRGKQVRQQQLKLKI